LIWNYQIVQGNITIVSPNCIKTLKQILKKKKKIIIFVRIYTLFTVKYVLDTDTLFF